MDRAMSVTKGDCVFMAQAVYKALDKNKIKVPNTIFQGSIQFHLQTITDPILIPVLDMGVMTMN
jgi:hypothetical protein